MAKQKKVSMVPNNVLNMIGNQNILPVGKFSVEHYLDWTYSSLRTVNGNLHQNFRGDSDKKLIRTFTEFICKTYMMTDMPTYQIDTKKVIHLQPRPTLIEEYRIQVARRLKRLMRNSERTNISFRLVGEHESFVMIAYLEDNFITVVSATFDGLLNVCKCSYDTETDFSGLAMLERIHSSPFYLSRKTRVAETLVMESEVHSTDLTTLRYIDECVRCYKEESPESSISQTPYEMYFIKKTLKSMSLPYWPMDIRNWISPGSESYDNKNFSTTTLGVVDIVTNRQRDQYPLIDIGHKELDFIMKYSITNGILGGDDDKAVDLCRYISNMPYGDIFRFPVESNEYTGEIIGTFILDEETYDLRMILIYDIPGEDMVIFSTIDYENIKEFNHIRSCRGCNTTLLVKRVDKIPSNLDILDIGIQKIFLDSGSIDRIVSSFIALYVILHDRPSRNRMVNCTQKILRTPKPQQRKKSKKEEYDYVVTRILKTTQGAKKYVAEMNASGQIDREYTLESWPRKGYYRRTRGGGSVWIPPTTCHRHLALSEKEIHIKL